MDLRLVPTHPDHWYPVARAGELAPGRMLPVSFAGENIVLVRTEAGGLHALEDRCAHRQVPLHEGALCGNLLRCGYHGWAYDMLGRCVDVPYLADRAVNGVRAYPCRESCGLIFVFPGDPAQATDKPVPAPAAYADPAYKTRLLDRRVACHYTFMHENLMDMNHQFLHRSLMGGIKTIPLGHESGPGWIEARYTFARTSGKRPWGEKFMIGERDESGTDKDTMTIRTDCPYQTLTFRRAGKKETALELWLSYVPLDKRQATNRTLGLMMIRKPEPAWIITLLWPFIARFTDAIFEQDRKIVELEQLAFDRQGRDENREVFPVIRDLRRVLAESGGPLPIRP